MPLGVEKPHGGRSVGPRNAVWSQPLCLFCGVKVATCCLKPLDVWGLFLSQLMLSWLSQASIAFPAWFSVTLIYPLILRPNLPFLIRTCAHLPSLLGCLYPHLSGSTCHPAHGSGCRWNAPAPLSFPWPPQGELPHLGLRSFICSSLVPLISLRCVFQSVVYVSHFPANL